VTFKVPNTDICHILISETLVINRMDKPIGILQNQFKFRVILMMLTAKGRLMKFELGSNFLARYF
jgi:hypothetical protein